MNRLRKICLAIAAPLFCVSGIFAQEKNPADTTAVTTPAAPQDAASDDTEETLPPFDEKAPIMKGKPKRYFIRKINLRGIEYLNKTVVQASTGLVPGDSIYLPSENIAVRDHWDQVVGVENAKHSYPASLRDGVLTIRCDSPAWTTTLSYMTPLLTDTIRRKLEGLTINEVRVTGPQSQGFSRGRISRKIRY